MSERVLGALEPARVFHYFEEIARIPRPSFHEEAISDYLVSFAKSHGFDFMRDEAKNVIITRPASPGYEEEAPYILQGHMDMVCEKNSDCEKDMFSEGLDLFIDGDLIGAKGTTLGGDDGIAIAIALALLEDESLRCPRLEFVCTTSEETGMEGASAIDLSSLQGRRLLNIDSEIEKELVCGCAGGGRLAISLPADREDFDGVFRRVRLSGLLGGHSGTQIHLGRANANTLMARVLRHILQAIPMALASLRGGDKDNAIPRESCALIAVKKEDAGRLDELIEEARQNIRSLFEVSDPSIRLDLEEADPSEERTPVTLSDTKAIVLLMLSMPNGVVRMSSHIEGLVETSLNLGIISLNELDFTMSYSLRSSVKAAYEALRENMLFMAEGYGAEAEIHGEYPAWPFSPDSPLQKKLCDHYQRLFGERPAVNAIHAGLECGILSEKLPGLDAVSMGPDLFDIHTPQERMSISSVARLYEWLRAVLQDKE